MKQAAAAAAAPAEAPAVAAAAAPAAAAAAASDDDEDVDIFDFGSDFISFSLVSIHLNTNFIFAHRNTHLYNNIHKFLIWLLIGLA